MKVILPDSFFTTYLDFRTSDQYDEEYKWIAYKHWLQHWNWSTTDKITMLNKCFVSGIGENLWQSSHYYPIKMLLGFLEFSQDDTISIIDSLFDESLPLDSRMSDFKANGKKLLASLNQAKGEDLKSHYFSERFGSLLLSIQYPEKYAYYKHGVFSKFSKSMDIEGPKKGSSANYQTFMDTIDELKTEVQNNEHFIKTYREFTGKEEYYNDEQLLLLSQDLMYTNELINQTKAESIVNTNREASYWLYAPGQNANMWDSFYSDGIIALGWDQLGDLTKYKGKSEIAKNLIKLDTSGNASSKKNNSLANHEFDKVLKPGDIVFCKNGLSQIVGCGIITGEYYFDEDAAVYKSRRKIKWTHKGEWKVTWDLVNKTLTDITKYKGKNWNREKEEQFRQFDSYGECLLALVNGTFIPDASNQNEKPINKLDLSLNTILYGPPGTGKTYQLQKTYFPKFTEIKKKSQKETLLSIASSYSWWELISIAVLDLGESKVVDIFKHPLIQVKSELSSSKTPQNTIWAMLQRHTKQDCPNVNFTKRTFPQYFWKTENSEWSIDEKILSQEKPELAEELEKLNTNQDNATEIKRYHFVTFHQSFTYEDFIEGIKPKMTDDSEGNIEYEIQDGIFKQIANTARADSENDYCLFIDEINRGNVSSIFGELITLIEDDKRQGNENELSLILPYSKSVFSVPNNLYIIGTMNTADRSVEALDSALRRRFSFIEMSSKPALLSNSANNGSIGDIDLIQLLKTINLRISKLIDSDHAIGHSYFFKVTTKQGLITVFKDKVIPLLEEYFFGDLGKLGLILGKSFIKESNASQNIRMKTFNGYGGNYSDDMNEKKVFKITSSNGWDFKDIYID
ncbi:MAG: hypothetical protein ACJATI_003220 [Halioglobus sp.]|jgi:hypothetical protein